MIKGMTLPKGGNRLPLILGLVLGLVAAVLVVVVLTGSKDSGTTSQTGGGGDVPVVVAATNIAAGTRISAEMLKVGAVSQEDFLPGAFGTTEGLVGQVTRVSLVPGEQIIQSKVVNSQTITEFGGNPPLSLLIEPGTRAVSAQMSSLIGAGGNVRPGDFVDVILIVETNVVAPDGTQFNDTVAGTFLQNVKVLAIDTERANPDPEAATDPDAAKENNEAATTVTLSLSPVQAEVLVTADMCGQAHGGRLAISLRGPGDPNKLSNRSEWPADGPIPTCLSILGVSSLGE